MAALKTTINGFRTTVTVEMERVLKLLDLTKESFISSSLVGPMCVEAANALIYCHNILQTMVGGERASDLPEGTKLNRRMTDDASLKYLRQEIRFVIGAVNDPFLHSVNEEYRDGAILNLQKAAAVLNGRIEWFKSDEMFRIP